MAKKTTKKKKAVRKPSTALVRRLAESTALDIQTTDSPGVVMIKLARDPRLSVDKLERLIGAQERQMDRQAKAEFDAAYDAMAEHIPVIKKNGKIHDKNKQVVGRYGKFEDISRILKPILRRFGFTIKYHTDWPDKLLPEVVGVLTHKAGHSETSRFRSPAEDSGYKNQTQGLGSANAYGRRYTTIDLLNLVFEGEDDDATARGGGRGRGQEPPPHEQAPPRQEPPKPAHDPNDELPITRGTKDHPGQFERFHVIRRNSKRDDVVVRMWLARRFGVSSSAAIKRKDYEFICKALETPGELPELPTREPGEDG